MYLAPARYPVISYEIWIWTIVIIINENSFFLISEENREEVYEEVYKTKSNYPKIEWVSLFLTFVANGISLLL